MNIIICGDTVPTKSNSELFSKGKIKELIGDDLAAVFENAEYRIFNLETPLCDALDPIPKAGPNLNASTNTIEGFKGLKFDMAVLANNHIMDQGVKGLESTIKALIDSDIDYIGAGKNIEVAKKGKTFNFGDKTIGIYTCAEHEFSIADREVAGANPANMDNIKDDLSALRKQCDYTIVIYHGGKEHYRYPSPKLMNVAHRIADSGANLILFQHSHCVGCEEIYGNTRILYGQGNFIFDYSNDECWNTGLVVSINEKFDIEYIPIIRDSYRVRLAKGYEGELILNDFINRSQEILDYKNVESKYREFALDYLNKYLKALSGKKSIIYRVFDKISHGRYSHFRMKMIYRKEELLLIQNIVECEAHNELLICGLRERIKQYN